MHSPRLIENSLKGVIYKLRTSPYIDLTFTEYVSDDSTFWTRKRP